MASVRYLWDKQRTVEVEGDGQFVPDKTVRVTPLSDGSIELDIEQAAGENVGGRSVQVDLTRDQVLHLLEKALPRKLSFGSPEGPPQPALFGLSCGYWSKTKAGAARHAIKAHGLNSGITDVPESTYEGRPLNRCRGRLQHEANARSA